jgi:hypothetical protein
MYFIYLFIIFLNFVISLQTNSIQTIKVRENVNVTMTCRLNTGQNLLATNQLSSSVPSLSSFNKIFDNQFSGNIILWYKDDTQVIGVNSISNDPQKYLIYQENFNTYQLTIINVQLESSGLYKCQNFTAKEENLFQLNVMGKFYKMLDDIVRRRKKKKKNECLVSKINLFDSTRMCLLLLEYVKQTVGSRADMLIVAS